MDISPGGCASDDLKFAAEQTATTTSDHQLADVASVTEDSTSSLTFLNTLAKLQQALQQVTADKLSSGGATGNTSKAVPPSVLSLLATLPSLICKLKTAGGDRESQASTLCERQSSQPADQQQITLQGE